MTIILYEDLIAPRLFEFTISFFEKGGKVFLLHFFLLFQKADRIVICTFPTNPVNRVLLTDPMWFMIILCHDQILTQGCHLHRLLLFFCFDIWGSTVCFELVHLDLLLLVFNLFLEFLVLDDKLFTHVWLFDIDLVFLFGSPVAGVGSYVWVLQTSFSLPYLLTVLSFFVLECWEIGLVYGWNSLIKFCSTAVCSFRIPIHFVLVLPIKGRNFFIKLKLVVEIFSFG